LLLPQPSVKRLALGRTWVGSLIPKLDAFISQADTIVTGHLAEGELLGPVSTDLGVSAEDLAGDIVEGISREPTDVDLREIYGELQAFRRSVGSSPTQNEMRYALGRLRSARDRYGARARSRGTADAQAALRAMNEASRARNRAINEANARRYGAAGQRATTDSMTDVRDAVHAAHTATSAREWNAAINAANRAFWAQRTRGR